MDSDQWIIQVWGGSMGHPGEGQVGRRNVLWDSGYQKGSETTGESKGR